MTIVGSPEALSVHVDPDAVSEARQSAQDSFGSEWADDRLQNAVNYLADVLASDAVVLNTKTGIVSSNNPKDPWVAFDRAAVPLRAWVSWQVMYDMELFDETLGESVLTLEDAILGGLVARIKGDADG